MSELDFSDPATIATLTRLLAAAGLAGLQIDRPGQSLRVLVARSNDTPERATRPDTGFLPTGTTVKAPMAGEFLTWELSRRRDIGWQERADIAGFLRVGPVLLPLKLPRGCFIERHIAVHGTVVSYGDPLFEIGAQS